jgi:transcriptional regulator with XRE-family HTH domain
MTPESLKAWRSRRVWSQANAARQLGLSANGYSAYETGKRPIPRHVEFACMAIEQGLVPLNAKTPR